ncbi:MAG: RNA polymerase sigma factor SigZ [Bacteroidota bacterium]
MEITAIHNEFHSVLNNYIVKRVNNRDDAKDLLQEVFIKIHGNLSGVDKKENLKSWLFAITKNTIIDYYRRNAQKTSFTSVDNITDGINEQDFDRSKELEKCIHRFIEQLPDEYREIIIDSEIKGIKQKDLAGKYDLAYPSVRSRVQRGRARLKEMFMDCCKIELDRRGNILEAIPKPGKC